MGLTGRGEGRRDRGDPEGPRSRKAGGRGLRAGRPWPREPGAVGLLCAGRDLGRVGPALRQGWAGPGLGTQTQAQAGRAAALPEVKVRLGGGQNGEAQPAHGSGLTLTAPGRKLFAHAFSMWGN